MSDIANRVVLTGATGFVGSAVAAELLSHGHELVVFSRDPQAAAAKVPGAAEYVAWQPEASGLWAAAVDGADAVVHCAAASIFDRRYTRQVAHDALANRVISTRGLVNAMAQAAHKPRVFVNSASQGIYGFEGVSQAEVDERTPPATDYWGQDSKPWEDEALRAESLGIRTVVMRIGYVLGADGGGLPYQVRQARKGQSGISRPAEASLSWIHIRDLARLFRFAVENASLHGPVNGTAPQPASNGEYAELLGQLTGQPVKLMPYPLVRLFVGKVAEIYTRQKRVIPRQALAAGFTFDYPTLAEALADLAPRVSEA